MSSVRIRPYCSPTLVLLSFDWDDGKTRENFLGFAIKRTPGFNNENSSWLPNRIGFNGPAKNGQDLPSNTNPIQKFMWWDARFGDKDRRKTFTYTVMPVIGKPNHLHLLDTASSSKQVTLPPDFEDSIGTYFNRAVVSSQAFSHDFGTDIADQETLHRALTWLANGLEKVIPDFVSNGAESIEGMIYHITDKKWILPSFKSLADRLSLVYYWKEGHGKPENNDTANEIAKTELDKAGLYPRTKTNLMHNKVLVKVSNGKPIQILMGSANFTTEGLTTQANLIHTFDSTKLATLYLNRKKMLESDPAVAQTSQEARWQPPVNVGRAKIRVFFSPEPQHSRESIDRIINSVKEATNSVLFCVYDPTDSLLFEAIFEKADKEHKMMFGLVNSISKPKGTGENPNSGNIGKVTLYHRSSENRDVYSYSLYPKKGHPEGFWWENTSIHTSIPDSSMETKSKWEVHIHHKFIIIDGETEHPVIYTGSANMSDNSVHENDENLLEIRDAPKLAQIYLAEFFRLYEHYRARAARKAFERGDRRTYELAKGGDWRRDYYDDRRPQFKSRVSMAQEI
ncbi:MAG: phospholipase D-like domain-containing protein [Thermoproteota archaeon]|nr:phospholipase D-like domain-containing protein [Thermoproteota archaeon]